MIYISCQFIKGWETVIPEGTISQLDQPGASFHKLLLGNLKEAVNLLNPELRILYTNPVSDRLTGFARTEVIGKPCLKNLMLSSGESPLIPCSRRCPVQKTLDTGSVQIMHAYIRHKQGHMLPIEMRVIPIPGKNGATQGALEIFSETSPKLTMPMGQDELERMNMLDPLTMLGTRRFLEVYLQARLSDMKKFNQVFGILFIDVDGMQRINDSYGSVVGDKLLRMVSQTLTSNIRFFEVVGRWDGKKFLVVLLNIDETTMDLVANKLRLLVEQSNIREQDKLLRTTASIGATLARTSDNIETLVRRAEILAQQSKRMGRNRVSLPSNQD